MVYVSFESPSPKSLAQLVEQLKKIQGLEQSAIAALADAVDGYRACCPSPEYWEGLLSQVLALFPADVVKKQTGNIPADIEAEFELAETRLEAGREIEDLRENVQSLERELAEVRAERDELRKNLTVTDMMQSNGVELTERLEKELANKTRETHKLNEERTLIIEGFQERIALFESELTRYQQENKELKEKLSEWESKGNELANQLIESSVGDSQEKDADIQRLRDRNTFLEQMYVKHQEYEKLWTDRFVQQSEEIRQLLLQVDAQPSNEELKKVTEDRDNLLIRLSDYNERFAKWHEKEVQPAIEQAEKYDRLLTQCEKELDQAKKTIEILERSSANSDRRELEEKILRLTAEIERLTNGTPTPKSDTYVEFINLSENVGYLKVKETGEILSAYVGTNNQKTESGRVLGKSILKDWASRFELLFSQSRTEVRKGKRLKTDWELKIVGLPMEEIEKLSGNDYSQSPKPPVATQRTESKEVAEVDPQSLEFELVKAQPFDHLCPEYHVQVQGEDYGRVWKIPGRPNAWKHNIFGPNDEPFNSPEEAAKHLVAIEKEAEAESEQQDVDVEF